MPIEDHKSEKDDDDDDDESSQKSRGSSHSNKDIDFSNDSLDQDDLQVQ